jgi:ubiquinone/menaquinone biosynthesis C-methylase UbiE
MLAVTREKLKANHPVFNGVNGSTYEIPLVSESRDAVISINVFNHIQEPATAIKEINRILRPNGKLLINFTNLYSIYWPFASYINSKHTSIGRDVYSVWSKPKEVSTILSASGFNILDVVGHVFVPLYLDKPVLRRIPIFLDGLSRKAPLKWMAPSLFYYCEKR